MPIPLIVAVAAAALAAAGLLGKSLVDAARGKQIVVLGPRMTGKSTLTDFLHTGQIRRQYIPTQARREFKCDVKLETVGLKLKIIDFSGDKSAWKDAREKARNADQPLFLASWRQLMDERPSSAAPHHSPKDLTRRAADQVGSWNPKNRPILIITHADFADAEVRGEIESHTTVRDLKRLLRADKVYAANLMDEAEISRLGISILETFK